MACEVDQGAIIDDEPVLVLADDRGLHSVEQDRAWSADQALFRRSLFVSWRLEPLGNVGSDGLSVDADLTRDRADGQTLAMQIQDHDEFPKFDHRALHPACGKSIGDSASPPTSQGMPWMAGSHENWGIFKCHKRGELLRHSHALLFGRALISLRTVGGFLRM
jgi:hypothetical protein